MALVFAIMHNSFSSIPFSHLLSGIKKLECVTIPLCPSLMYSFNSGNIEGTKLSKFVFDVCACFIYVCVGIGFVD